VNKFPDVVRYIVQRLKVLCLALGKVKIAQILARAGLHLGVTTVGRMLKATPCLPGPVETLLEQATENHATTVVTAKRPNHVWHVDLTAVPLAGLWVPWLPFALPQRWPFCWWLAIVVDHFSRRVMGVAVFTKQPTSIQVRAFLGRLCSKVKPKYIICDKGSQFWCDGFKAWCKRKRIRPRFGAVGKCGSIAVIERFILSMKSEGLRRILVPLHKTAFRQEVQSYVDWFNSYRPHTALEGRTPDEAYRRIAPANKRPRWEPRQRWPNDANCAGPRAKLRGDPGVCLELTVTHLNGQQHLPIIKLKRVA
jgi:putative transposase